MFQPTPADPTAVPNPGPAPDPGSHPDQGRNQDRSPAGGSDPDRGRGWDREIGTMACRIEAELRFVVEAWGHLDGEQRSGLVRTLSVGAPGVLELLCPAYGRFTRLG